MKGACRFAFVPSVPDLGALSPAQRSEGAHSNCKALSTERQLAVQLADRCAPKIAPSQGTQREHPAWAKHRKVSRQPPISLRSPLIEPFTLSQKKASSPIFRAPSFTPSQH